MDLTTYLGFTEETLNKSTITNDEMKEFFKNKVNFKMYFGEFKTLGSLAPILRFLHKYPGILDKFNSLAIGVIFNNYYITYNSLDALVNDIIQDNEHGNEIDFYNIDFNSYISDDIIPIKQSIDNAVVIMIFNTKTKEIVTYNRYYTHFFSKLCVNDLTLDNEEDF